MQGSLEIFNMQHHLMAVHPIASAKGDWTLDTQNLPAGMYFYRLDIGGKTIDAGQLVIQK